MTGGRVARGGGPIAVDQMGSGGFAYDPIFAPAFEPL